MNVTNDGLQSVTAGSEATSLDPVLKALEDTRADRNDLASLVSPLIKTVWTDALNILFEYFPHQSGDQSSNERIYAALRNRILRVGNDQVRRLPMILGDFVIIKVRETKVTKYMVKGHGTFKLPAGVKVRGA